MLHDEPPSLEYLSRLPDHARYHGDARRGEIEIATSAEDHLRALSFLRRRFALLKLDPALAKLGVVYEDDYLAVIRDAVRFPNNFVGTYLRIMDRNTLDGSQLGCAAAILPMRDGAIWLRQMFRHPTRAWEIECPRGFSPGALTPADAAAAELQEEIGLGAIRLHRLGSVCADTGISGGAVDVFLAELQPGDPAPRPGLADALGTLVTVELRELREFVASGRIRDAFTLSALQLAWAHGYIAN